ncbi:hypothetical protein ACLOJK_009307 [Asimina triloba]
MADVAGFWTSINARLNAWFAALEIRTVHQKDQVGDRSTNGSDQHAVERTRNLAGAYEKMAIREGHGNEWRMGIWKTGGLAVKELLGIRVGGARTSRGRGPCSQPTRRTARVATKFQPGLPFS